MPGALERGAVDCLVKPFSTTELPARIDSALRKHDEPSAFHLTGDLTIDHNERRVTLDDRPVRLTPAEYDLLSAISANAGRVSACDHLIRRVWRTRRADNTRSYASS